MSSLSRDQIVQEKRAVGKGRTDWKKTALRFCGEWSEQLSSKGKIYYYNSRTEVSQWQRPREWSLPEVNAEQLKESYNERRKRQDSTNKSNHSKRLNTSISSEQHYRSSQTTNSTQQRHQLEHQYHSPYPSSNNNQKRLRLDDSMTLTEKTKNTNNHQSPHGRPYNRNSNYCSSADTMSGTKSSSITAEQYRKTNDSSTNQRVGQVSSNSIHRPCSGPWLGSSSVISSTTHNSSSFNNNNSTCTNDDMDISPGSSPLSGKSGSPSMEHSPYLSSTSHCVSSVHHSDHIYTEGELMKVVNSVLDILLSRLDCSVAPVNHLGKPDLLQSFRMALLTYKAEKEECLIRNKVNPTSLFAPTERLYQKLGEVLFAAQALSSSPGMRVNGERQSSFNLDDKNVSGTDKIISSQFQQLLSRLKLCLPPPSSSSNSQVQLIASSSAVGNHSNPPLQQLVLESLISGLSQVAKALNNHSSNSSPPPPPPTTSQTHLPSPHVSVTSSQPSTKSHSVIMGNGKNHHRNNNCETCLLDQPPPPPPPPPTSASSSTSLLNTPPPTSNSLSSLLLPPPLSSSIPLSSSSNNCVAIPTTTDNNSSVSSSNINYVTGFSSLIPTSLPPIISASFSVKETPSQEDANRWQMLLSNTAITQFVDNNIALKYCDAAADRLVKEALLEQQKFDKLQSVLYGELSCESKTLRALARIPETQAGIHQLKHDLFQSLTEYLSQRKPAVSFYDST